MMLITVSEKHSPAPPRKSGTVVTDTGQKLDCWPDKLIAIQVGRQYEVETSTNARGFTSITKVTPVNGAALAPAPASNPAPVSTGEAEFVGRILHALILKGEIQPKEIAAYTTRLRQVWRESEPRAYSEAAE